MSNGRTTPSGIPSSGRTTPSGIPSSGRMTPSGIHSGRATPSGIPGPRNSLLGSGIPTSGRSTPVGGRRSVSGESGLPTTTAGRRESGIHSPYSGGGIAKPSRDSMALNSSTSGAGNRRESLTVNAGAASSAGAGGHAGLVYQPPPTPTGSMQEGSGSGTSVQVALRIRPAGYDANVPTRFQRTVVSATNPTTVSVDSAPPASATASSQATKPQKFLFDRVYGPEEGQEAIWSSVEGLVSRFLEGYNVTVLAYGQTSSGKSYTMGTDRLNEPITEVPADRLGIIPRAVHTLFSAMQQLRGPKVNFTARNSYIEIYNEDLIDLLASSSAGQGAVLPQVQIREDKDGRIIWSGLREESVKNVEEVMDNLERGSAVRQTNSTDMNAQSSRSHAVFSITLTQKKFVGSGTPSAAGNRASKLPAVGSRSSTPTEGHRERPSSRLGADAGSDGEWVTVSSKFHFVDLAGSERLKRTAAAGERIKEGISINSGLHALGNVISALGDPSKARTTTHIPYRDSKLTRLLQDSLGGNAHTLMIACISPSEYNLNETLNTLKYANRARNIKNRAEVNEVEVGWDDVEHLQNVVIKLRKELAYLRSGTAAADYNSHGRGALSSIDEEGSLGLRADLAELQGKYAKALADLSVAQSTERPASPGGTPALSQSDFEGLIQPVVEEYEKSITALESQLALLKAALVHSEESMREQEEKLDFEQQVNETNAGVIGDLKSRVAKLAEREALTETYVRDLEAKLKGMTDQDETSNGLLSELKKEVAKYREGEGRSERYIKDLEARLAQSDEANVSLRSQIEALERDVQRREEAYKDLEGRAALLDTSDQQKLLLEELDEKQKRVLELERTVDQQKLEKEAFDRERQRLEDEAKGNLAASATLQEKIRDLEERHTAAPAQARELASASGDSPRPLTKPDSENHTRSEQTRELADQLAALQTRYDQAVSELDAVTSKYKDSLKELEDLSSQVEEARLIHSESSDHVPFPSPCPSPSPSLQADSFPLTLPTRGFGNTVPDDALETLSNPSTPSAPHPSRSPRMRRSVPITPGRTSFLGSKTPTGVHTRTLSLSQELSSAHGSRGSLLLSTSPSRSVSPTTPREPERSQDSLRKEIMQLQEALKDREEEINSLERSLHEMRRRSSDTDSRTSEEESDRSQRSDGSLPPRTSSLAVPTAANDIEEDGTAKLSPATEQTFQDLKHQLGDEQINGVADPKAVERLEDLMRSMAKKESAHLELIEDLKDRLAGTTRKHEDLEKLSRDQVVNMSTEIEALRDSLNQSSIVSDGIREQLEAMERTLAAKHEELERSQAEAEASLQASRSALDADHQSALAARDEQHVAALRQTQEEHAEVLRRMLDEREQLFVSKIAEFEEAQRSTVAAQEAARAELTASQDAKLRANDETHTSALQRQAEEHQQALARLSEEHRAFPEATDGDQSKKLESLIADHAAQLEQCQAAHATALAELRHSLESTASSAHEQHTAAIRDLQTQHDDAIAKSIEDHSAAMAQLREQHAIHNNAIRKAHEEALASQGKAHDISRAELKASHDREVSDLRRTHERQLEEQRTEHEEILVASLTELDSRRSKKHDVVLSNLRTAHAEEMARVTFAHEETVKTLKAGHESAMRSIALNSSTSPRVEEIAAFQDAATIAELKTEHASAIAAQEAAHQAIIESLKMEHERQTHAILSGKQTGEDDSAREKELLAQGVAEAKSLRLVAEKQRDEHAARVDQLTQELETAVAAHRTEVDDLKRQLASLKVSAASGSPGPARGTASELREALETLATLEKALVESQAEKDRLVGQLANAQKTASSALEPDGQGPKYESIFRDLETHRASLATMQVELTQTRQERDHLSREKQRLVDEGSRYRRPSDASVISGGGCADGRSSRQHPVNGINGFGRAETPPMIGGLQRTSKPPPPTPPPTGPPPPIPANALPSLPGLPSLSGVLKGTTSPPPPSAPAQPNGSPNAATAGPAGTAVRDSNASSSASRRDSADDGAPSQRSGSVAESVSMEPRVMKKLEEQEALIAKLTKQLTHCETDLKANIDLVANLESALNDTERNLRKSRLQMNDLTKERDKLSSSNDALRSDLVAARSEADSARHSVLQERTQFDARLSEERKQKETARRQLENRLEEMQNSKLAKKSKFNCF